MAIIELDQVDVRYGDLEALKGVSCAIEAGTVGLLGPNGAGKSTLIKTLLGFNRPHTGTVRIFGLDMPHHALEVRQQLGYMPEFEVVSPKISAVSFLTYCGRIFGMSHVDALERTHQVLNYVGLGESRYRKMETFSTGMLQRTKLAQALVHDPKLLLLDEPTNGLDPEGRVEVLELIRDVSQQRGVTVILSSHLLPDVQQVCDHIIMIDGGRIVREGSLDDLMERREAQYEVRVRDSKEAFVAAVEAAGCMCRERPDGNLLVSGATDQGQSLFRIALEVGTQIRHFLPARDRLEDVFIKTVRKERKETAA